jgi:hypothetical protein
MTLVTDSSDCLRSVYPSIYTGTCASPLSGRDHARQPASYLHRRGGLSRVQ